MSDVVQYLTPFVITARQLWQTSVRQNISCQMFPLRSLRPAVHGSTIRRSCEIRLPETPRYSSVKFPPCSFYYLTIRYLQCVHFVISLSPYKLKQAVNVTWYFIDLLDQDEKSHFDWLPWVVRILQQGLLKERLPIYLFKYIYYEEKILLAIFVLLGKPHTFAECRSVSYFKIVNLQELFL